MKFSEWMVEEGFFWSKQPKQVPASEYGLEYRPPAEWEYSTRTPGSKADWVEIPINSISLSRNDLYTSKVENLKRQLNPFTPEDHEPIFVINDPKRPGKYVAVSGNHRVAALKSSGKHDKIMVKLRTYY